jgi:putative ABC transport system permease protein
VFGVLDAPRSTPHAKRPNMFKLNLKIAWRNLWKNKTYTAINIIGLSAGLAGFMIILLYINKETGYDKWDPALKRSYIIASDFTKNGAQNKGSKIKGLLSKVINEQINEAEAVSIGSFEGRNIEVRNEHDKKDVGLKLSHARVDSNFFKVFSLKPMFGKMEGIFTDIDAIAISYTAAEKLFGRADVLNQVVIQHRGVNAPEGKLTIKAVWDDREQPSAFGIDIIMQENLEEYGNQILSTPFSTIFRLREGVEAKKTLQKINDAYIIALAKLNSGNSDVNFHPNKTQALQILKEKEGITSINIIAEPISHLNLSNFYTTNPKQTTIYILCALASFLIIISCINYTNLTLVLAQARAKEVGIKKVLGAFKWSLIKQFFAETAIQCAISFLLALILAELLLPQVNQILTNDLSLFRSTGVGLIMGQVTLILIGIMLLAGAYPALILAGFLPVKVLKGSFNTSLQIGSLRKVLIVFQFTVAIALVISFGVIYAQLSFMKQKDLGLKTNQLMSITIAKYENRKLDPARFESIKNRLLAIKGVEAITRATEEPINDSGFEDDISFNTTTLSVESRYVDPNYLNVIGAKILKGRDYSYQLLATDSTQSILLNETAFKQLGLSKTDTQIDIDRGNGKGKTNVIGVVKDIQAYGFNQAISPTVYLVSDYPFHWRKNIVFRLNTSNVPQTLGDIKTAWKEIDPGAEAKFVFADETFAKMNESYEVSQQVIFSFGMVTLIISIFGLIGFAAYSAKMRIKEIAVRRILGASTTSILRLLNVDFVKLVIVATLLADILAYVYMQKWFSGFAYRIDMPIVVFALVNLIIVLITILTISLQSIKAVKANPVDALKYE